MLLMESTFNTEKKKISFHMEHGFVAATLQQL
jgi:hypothetical protein